MALASTTMYSPYLPLDLLDEILSHMYEDTTSLRRCCIASKAFVQPVRKQLFSSVTLRHERFGRDNKSCGRLCDLLKTDSQIISYIQELWIDGDSWIVQDEAFLAILNFLTHDTNLRLFSLALSFEADELYAVDGWSYMDEPSIEAILSVFRLPYLQTLSIHLRDRCTCTFPIENFGLAASTITQLSFRGPRRYDCSHEQMSVFTSALPIVEAKKPLKVLEIGGLDMQRFTDFFGGGHCPFSIARIHKLIIHGFASDGFQSGVRRTLKGAADTLEKIAWFHPNYDDDAARHGEPVDFQVLYRLQIAVFCVSLSSEKELSSLHSILEESPIPNSLMRLSLVIEDDSRSSILVTTDSESSNTAATIDMKLSHSLGRNLAAGMEVCVDILTHRSVQHHNETYKGVDLKSYFPQLNATGKLSVGLKDVRKVQEIVRGHVS